MSLIPASEINRLMMEQQKGLSLMGMDLTVYVGPFLRYTARLAETDAYDLTNGRLCDLRGEVGGNDDERYIGPNLKIREIARQLRYRRHDDVPVASRINKEFEIVAFVLQFDDDIRTIRKNHPDATVEWGIVPGYF